VFLKFREVWPKITLSLDFLKFQTLKIFKRFLHFFIFLKFIFSFYKNGKSVELENLLVRLLRVKNRYDKVSAGVD
jgi:hypothetical protein